MSHRTGIALDQCAEESLVGESYDRLLADIQSLVPNFPEIDDDDLEEILPLFFDFGVFITTGPNKEGDITVPYYRSINRLNEILTTSRIRAVPIGKNFEIVRIRPS